MRAPKVATSALAPAGSVAYVLRLPRPVAVAADRLERATPRELRAGVGDVEIAHGRDLGGGERLPAQASTSATDSGRVAPLEPGARLASATSYASIGRKPGRSTRASSRRGRVSYEGHV